MKPQDDGNVDPVPSGCTEEDFRKELRAAFERGQISGAQWASRLQHHMDAYMADPQNKRTYAKRTLVSFPVEHGDVVIMWGANTQRFMEHAVECRSSMRFAVTLRRVTGDMATKEQWDRLTARHKADRAFTPSWAGTDARKRKVEGKRGDEDEDEDDVDEDEDEGKAARAKKPKAKKLKAKK